VIILGNYNALVNFGTDIACIISKQQKKVSNRKMALQGCKPLSQNLAVKANEAQMHGISCFSHKLFSIE
jgi:hypothetical protein